MRSRQSTVAPLQGRNVRRSCARGRAVVLTAIIKLSFSQAMTRPCRTAERSPEPCPASFFRPARPLPFPRNRPFPQKKRCLPCREVRNRRSLIVEGRSRRKTVPSLPDGVVPSPVPPRRSFPLRTHREPDGKTAGQEGAGNMTYPAGVRNGVPRPFLPSYPKSRWVPLARISSISASEKRVLLWRASISSWGSMMG